MGTGTLIGVPAKTRLCLCLLGQDQGARPAGVLVHRRLDSPPKERARQTTELIGPRRVDASIPLDQIATLVQCLIRFFWTLPKCVLRFRPRLYKSITIAGANKVDRRSSRLHVVAKLPTVTALIAPIAASPRDARTESGTESAKKTTSLPLLLYRVKRAYAATCGAWTDRARRKLLLRFASRRQGTTAMNARRCFVRDLGFAVGTRG